MKTTRVYLDHNATTPVHPEVLTLSSEWLKIWGNGSSIHWAGQEAKNLLRESRSHLAKSLGVSPLEVIFTSGASESNNTVLKSLTLLGLGVSPHRRRLIASSVEHPSVLKTLKFLESFGYDVVLIPVSRKGVFDMSFYQKALTPETLLVSVMMANNETGHIFPIAEITELAHQVGALVHTDIVQAFGRLSFSLSQLGVDYASLSGHKFYGIKGTGALYCRRSSPFENLIHGGGQERDRRAGTENLLGIASLGYMAQKINTEEWRERNRSLTHLRDHFENRVLREISQVSITGRESLRLSNTTSLQFDGVDGESLLMSLDLKGFAVSTGAACSSGNPEPSHTLLAMGFTRAEAQSSLRVSLGWFNTLDEVDAFVDQLKNTVSRLRQITQEIGSRGGAKKHDVRDLQP